MRFSINNADDGHTRLPDKEVQTTIEKTKNITWNACQS